MPGDLTTRMSKTPTPRQERAARAWREATSAREAWLRFRAWLTRANPEDDTGDAPYWCDGLHSSHQLWTGPGATRLVLFEKRHVMERFLPDGRGSDRATHWNLATASAPFAPTPLDVKLIRAHARLLGGPIGFVGDLDPHALHVFGALRSGRLDAPDIAGRRQVVEWLGIDDEWLRRARKTDRPILARLIRMGWVEREYWEIIKRFAPSVRTLIGDESFALLDSGCTVESEAFEDMMPRLLRARLRSQMP